MGSMRTAIFRCDASVRMGNGHVMRCLTLAEYLRDRGWGCIFSVSPNTNNDFPLLLKSGFVITGSDEEYCGVGPVNLIVIDGYQFSASNEKFYRSLTDTIVVIDDLANRPHDCDVLIDQTYDRQIGSYSSFVPSHCTILTGAEYAILRPQFYEIRESSLIRRSNANGAIKRILISMGGTDPYNYTSQALSAVERFGFEIDVLIGSGSPHVESLKSYVRDMQAHGTHIHLHIDSSQVAELMAAADIAIGAAGTTAWERCCLGLPSILIELAENQKTIARNLMRAGAAYNLGWHGDVNAEMISRVVSKFIDNPDQVLEMSMHASNICDGRGIERLYRHLDTPLISIRHATIQDAERIYEWRNSDATRKASTNSNKIPFPVHMKWLKESLNNPLRDILIFEKNREPFGVLRFDYDRDTAVISIYLARQMIGQGLGTILLQRASSWLVIHRPEINKIYADVLAENTRSKKAFLGAGYQYCGTRLEKPIR